MSAAAAPATIPLADVQGLILRSYGMDALRVIALRVDQAPQARRLLGQIPLTSGSAWTVKPDFCINLGLTCSGLLALGLSADTLNSFPEDFQQGPIARAGNVGDTGDSAPEKWTDNFASPDVHVIVIIYAQTAEIRDQQTDLLKASWNGALSQVLTKDGDMLPGNVAHFGYRDGFSQPTIDGGLPNPLPDPLPKAPAGEFLLGYQSQFSQFMYPVPKPEAVGLNGSFMALRILEQDCAAFDQLVQQAPQKFGINGELLAAKMVGRWRNGVPLHQSPTTDSPNPTLPLEQLNNYDYLDDLKGQRCPIGSHMRRNNPRSSPIAGGVGTNHRIMRRGLPYGPPYNPAQPDDGMSRGLLGIFIVVSLKDQFEFLMSEWVNGSLFAPGLGGTKDPILGDNSNNTGRFVIPVAGGPSIVISGFSRLVQTRGAAYVFLPSLSAVKYISEL